MYFFITLCRNYSRMNFFLQDSELVKKWYIFYQLLILIHKIQENIVQEQDFNIRELVVVLKLNLRNIVVVAILAAFLGGLYSHIFITPVYEASINMIVNSGTTVDGRITSDGITSSEKLVDTYAIIIKGNIVLNQVIETLDLEKSYAVLNKQVKVNAVNETQVMKISVQDSDLEAAKKIVTAISEIAPPIIVDSVEAGSCKVISHIEASTKPVSPNIYKNAFTSGVVAVFIELVFLLTKSLINDSIEGEFDVERKLGIPVLGVIPEIEKED